MDGYGLTAPSPGNAIAAAATPVLDELYETCPNTRLSASGEDVGLPKGQIGNSEVGHTNIGAGRVVYQELPRISRDIETGAFFDNETLVAAVRGCKSSGGSLHLMGLVSPGGVHSHIDHLFGLLELAKLNEVDRVYIHCFMDGRDVPPDSGKESIAECVEKCRDIGVGKIATVTGRFYAMDRDNRWDRVEQAYNALVFGEGAQEPDPVAAMQASYDAGVTDEFVKPVVCDADGMVKQGDTVIFFNFRSDRAREITRAFIESWFDGFERRGGYFPVNFVTMTQYDANFTGIGVAYPPGFPEHTFGEILGNLGMHQLRIAETEKYAHVTFFFNGGVEQPFGGEERILVPSPKEFRTYDLVPEMSANKVADAVCDEILGGRFDVVIINFANCDMVGHTGDFAAAVKAVETVDICIGKVLDAVRKMDGYLVVTADHGNAEEMLAEDGVSKHTAHTTNPVPFIVFGADIGLRQGLLADIAPTLLTLLGIKQPEAMTGQSLII
ncbi:MAG: 2,3-bisphosphoglycerate-independent phosphoglycerate mutase [Oscillospiraceae bacterium]|nr:2,3-bisphosphoglycerate-independent phosphoglycerate mutase [Oscillospiraceae bacterium]MCL2126495.1 2,3-bisphosphoglycerate-independent phosphoglycerate mutase [Oscillospiraceae bacterium]